MIEFYGEEYQLRANIFQNDISAYGIDAPEHYIFACGFTLLSLALSVVMVLRFLLFRSYLIASGRRSGGCCCWNALVLGVGLLHAPAILLMAWSNGKQYDNTLHFFSAVIGLELLHVYTILNICLELQVLRSVSARPARIYLILDMIQASVIVIVFPLCIYRWITEYEAVYEWLVVVLLFGSLVPTVLHFGGMPARNDGPSIVEELADTGHDVSRREEED